MAISIGYHMDYSACLPSQITKKLNSCMTLIFVLVGTHILWVCIIVSVSEQSSWPLIQIRAKTSRQIRARVF